MRQVSRHFRNSWIDDNLTATVRLLKKFSEQMNSKRKYCYILHWDIEKRNHLPYERVIVSRKKEKKFFHMN